VAYITSDQFDVTPQVGPGSDGRVRVLLGTVRMVLTGAEAEAMGLQLLQQAKLARGANPAIQSGNTDLHDPAAPVAEAA
jgi:hypothetical protein